MTVNNLGTEVCEPRHDAPRERRGELTARQQVSSIREQVIHYERRYLIPFAQTDEQSGLISNHGGIDAAGSLRSGQVKYVPVITLNIG